MKPSFVVSLLFVSTLATAQVYVRPHTDRQGEYHEGHMRSAPNERRSDNYNAQNNQWGGTNPYTGQRGTQRDEFSNPPAYNRTSPMAPTQPSPPPQWGQQQRRNSNW